MDQPYCLVLSGGGAKGVYHLGVWKALGELGVEVEALVGTSIGAVMAAFLAQGSDDRLRDIVATMGLDSLFDLPAELVENGELKLDRSSLPALKDFFRSLVAKKGLDTGPLRQLLVDHLDEDRLRRSGKDLGFVTVNLSDLGPREVFLEDIEPGRLVDYLMASAAFPGFESPVIEGKRYIDGGLYDNIPFALARARGYRRIVVSDISGAGRNPKTEVEGGTTVYVRASIKMGGVLDLDPQFLEDFQTLGYLDTLRAFGRLAGTTYFVEPNPGAEAAHPLGPLATQPHRRDRYLGRLEAAARVLGAPRIRLYTYDSLEATLRTLQGEAEASLAQALGEPGDKKSLIALVNQEVRTQALRSPYHTWRLVEELMPGAAGDLLRQSLRALSPDLGPALEWLRT